MTEKQFKQWREAKAWELAVLIQGPFPLKKDFYRLHLRYGDLQKWILRYILEGGKPTV